jgi:uncharacterized protein DUF4383
VGRAVDGAYSNRTTVAPQEVSMSATRRGPLRGWTWPQLTTLVLGAFFTAVGLLGFRVSGTHDFFGAARHSFLGFSLNPFHNLVHVFLGAAGLLLAHTLTGARVYGWLLATVYGAGFVYGLFAAGQAWDLLGLNWADNIAHLVLALIGAALVAGPASTAVSDRPARA